VYFCSYKTNSGVRPAFGRLRYSCNYRLLSFLSFCFLRGGGVGAYSCFRAEAVYDIVPNAVCPLVRLGSPIWRVNIVLVLCRVIIATGDSKPHTGTTNGLRHCMRLGVPVRKEIMTVCVGCVGMRVVRARPWRVFQKCSRHDTHWHALSLNSCAWFAHS